MNHNPHYDKYRRVLETALIALKIVIAVFKIVMMIKSL